MLVSCLTVSKPDRWGLLQRSILDFKQQTVTDKEQIIAVTDGRYAEQIEEFVSSREIAGVRVISRDQRDQGGLLLHAQAASRGEYLAFWDDDNFNAPTRLATQLTYIPKSGPTSLVLADALYYFYETSEVFVTGFEQPNVALSHRSVVSSMIVPRSDMPGISHSGRGQNVAVTLADAIAKSWHRPLVVTGCQYLHAIGVRGDNLRGEEYHRKLATSLPLAKKADWLKENQAYVEKRLAELTWEPVELVVSGSDGTAFKTGATKRWSSEGYLYPIGGPSDGIERTTERVG